MSAVDWLAVGHAVTAAGFDRALLHGWDTDEVAAWWAMPDTARLACLHALAATNARRCGHVPPGHASVVRCLHCGPVWVASSMVRALGDDTHAPTTLGCPWCHLRAEVAAIPQPAITCQDCMHRMPDPYNPTAAMGGCAVGQGYHYPGARHRCACWSPRGDVSSLPA